MYEINGVVVDKCKPREEIWNPDEYMIGTKKIRPEAVKFIKAYLGFDKEWFIRGKSQEEIQELKDFVKGALDSVVVATPDPKGGFYLINSDIVTIFCEKQEDASEEQIKQGESILTLWGTFDVNRASLIDVKWLDLFAVGHLEGADPSLKGEYSADIATKLS